jgi:hypothetical protein
MSSTPNPTPQAQSTPPAQPTPQFPNLLKEEQAKMDYQAHPERTKLIPFWGARFWELFLDKFVFALLLAGFGALGLLYLEWDKRKAAEKLDSENKKAAKQSEEDKAKAATNLEKFKLDEARQRFFMEKRLEAILNMASAVSDLNRVFFTYAGAGQEVGTKAVEQEYAEALKGAREVINRGSVLFDEEFRSYVDRYFELHRAIMRVGVKDCGEHRSYLAQLNREFNALCLEIMQKEIAKPTPKDKMTLAPIDYDKRISTEPKDVVVRHVAYWKQSKKDKP